MTGAIRKYLVVCKGGFPPDHMIGAQARASFRTKISDHAWIVGTDASAETILERFRVAIPSPGGLFVSRLDFHEDMATFGMSEEAERSYGIQPARRVLKSLKKDTD